MPGVNRAYNDMAKAQQPGPVGDILGLLLQLGNVYQNNQQQQKDQEWENIQRQFSLDRMAHQRGQWENQNAPQIEEVEEPLMPGLGRDKLYKDQPGQLSDLSLATEISEARAVSATLEAEGKQFDLDQKRMAAPLHGGIASYAGLPSYYNPNVNPRLQRAASGYSSFGNEGIPGDGIQELERQGMLQAAGIQPDTYGETNTMMRNSAYIRELGLMASEGAHDPHNGWSIEGMWELSQNPTPVLYEKVHSQVYNVFDDLLADPRIVAENAYGAKAKEHEAWMKSRAARFIEDLTGVRNPLHEVYRLAFDTTLDDLNEKMQTLQDQVQLNVEPNPREVEQIRQEVQKLAHDDMVMAEVDDSLREGDITSPGLGALVPQAGTWNTDAKKQVGAQQITPDPQMAMQFFETKRQQLYGGEGPLPYDPQDPKIVVLTAAWEAWLARFNPLNRTPWNQVWATLGTLGAAPPEMSEKEMYMDVVQEMTTRLVSWAKIDHKYEYTGTYEGTPWE